MLHPAQEECQRCIDKYGVGSCGPRGFFGTIDVHLVLEVCCLLSVLAVPSEACELPLSWQLSGRQAVHLEHRVFGLLSASPCSALQDSDLISACSSRWCRQHSYC